LESAITALIIVTLVLFCALTLGQSFVATQSQIVETSRAVQAAALERSRTDLAITGARTDASGDVVEITVRNTGQVRLADYALWDVIIDYTVDAAYRTQWFPYVSAVEPGQNQWTVAGIYRDAAHTLPETFDPGILNPGEEMVLRVRVAPAVAVGSSNLATVAAPNGISSSAMFAR
jgi:archaellum component FlaF (FlaF/FlaG flagellin family)